MAPGRRPSRSGLSAGGEVRIPATNATHAQDRIDPITSGAQCKRLRASKPSKPIPTNHQAGRQKNGTVMVCHARVDNAAGCRRRNETTGTERGAPTIRPGRLRSVIRWKRRSPMAARGNISRRSRGSIHCLEWIVAFRYSRTAPGRAYMNNIGISTTADQTASSAIGSRTPHETSRGLTKSSLTQWAAIISVHSHADRTR
jgi:hypothetical protein